MYNYLLDDCINCSRLKSKRKKKQLAKKDFEKELIQLSKLEKELWKKHRALPLLPLVTPYQKGWERYFVLREDVAKSNDAVFYNVLLEKINTIQYASDKSFKNKKRKKGMDVYNDRRQAVKDFLEYEWLCPKLELTDKEQTHFYKVGRWSPNGKSYRTYYVFEEPWRFVLRVRPNMITHTKMVDADLESEIANLRNYLTNNFLRYSMLKIVYGRVKHRRWKEKDILKYQNPLTNKPIHTLMYEFNEEKENLNRELLNSER
ncbi:hypothetical protein [Flavobacterium piscis]|uniref:Uncharacterized protein n=1 Tax=Flavobacterium piscis TaxID=1114874 RepID=A0ABU1Y8T1_9FLAO|nr:hypothetical protein [Flavobacterium piscis]MDR7210642.1 hypothetical protein [Flavobacterium piscis]